MESLSHVHGLVQMVEESLHLSVLQLLISLEEIFLRFFNFFLILLFFLIYYKS